MPKILISQGRREEIFHRLALKNKNNTVSGVSLITTDGLLKTDQKENRTASVVFCMRLLDEISERCPVYRGMFRYPAFVSEILSFARELCLYQISPEALPEGTVSEKELKMILRHVMTMDLEEKAVAGNREQLIRDAVSDGLTVSDTFETVPFRYRFIQDLIRSGAQVQKDERHDAPARLMYALNVRQEIESIAQQICRTQKSCNVILTSYTAQYPVLKQVFMRYGIPYSTTHEEITVRIPSVFASLLMLAADKDSASLTECLRINAFSRPCPDRIYPFLKETLQDTKAPEGIAERFENSSMKNEAGYYRQMEDDAREYFAVIGDEIDLLVHSGDAVQMIMNAYQVMSGSPLLENREELAAALKIRSLLTDILPGIRKEEIPFAADLISSLQGSFSRYDSSFCSVTDLTHPVSAKKITYIAGCTGKNFPGFPARKGLFDEAYVSRIEGYPAMSERFQIYTEQLKWIDACAEDETIYSYYTNDYQGRQIQPAFELDRRFKNSAKAWQPVKVPPARKKDHALSAAGAEALFQKDGRITGSISTIERWFSCPYAYFIQSGLHIRKADLSAMQANTIGNIQHSLMEHAVTEKHKQYAEITREEVRDFLQESFDVLKCAHPNEAYLYDLTCGRMLDGLMVSLEFLNDMEKYTAFAPAEAEKEFRDEIAEGVMLRGIIDRIDTVYNLVRIIDYKSSAKSLSETKVKAGLQLQLLSYLIIAEKLTGKTPAGSFYFSMKAENIRQEAGTYGFKNGVQQTDIQADIFKQFIKARRLCGWSFTERKTETDENGDHIVGLGSTFDFDAVRQCITELYQYFRSSLLEGNIALSPVEGACTFCDYRSICRFSSDYRKVRALAGNDLPFKTAKAKGGRKK